MPDDESPEYGETTQHFPAPTSGDTGWVLGNRYRITGRIGAGGMADVFRANDQLLNRDVAVKVFRTSAAGADTAAGAERQRAELHALARLNHPNLITLYDGSVAGPDDPESRAYLVMELVEGPNLGSRIENGPLPTEPEVRAIGAQIADALAYVHAQGMVHRDVKPANILLGAGTGNEPVRARLSDFGIVRLVGAERLTQADSTLGTASYLAPEQARGSAVGPPADIHALGLTLIETLTGVRSFDGATPMEAVVARLDRDPVIPQDVPQPWPGLLAAMTARDPSARPTAQQVADALRGGATGGLAAATTQYVPAAAAVAGATTVLPPTGAMPPVRPVPVAEPLQPPLPEPEPKERNVGLIVGLILAGVLIFVAILIIVATSGGDDSTAPVAPTTSASTTPTTPGTSSGSEETQSPTEQSEEPTQDETSEEPTSEERTSEEPTTQEQTTPPTTTPPTTPPTSSTSQTGTSDGAN